jgi:serine/threonine protein kinase
MRLTSHDSFRDVCYAIKVGKQQLANTVEFDANSTHSAEEMKELKMETLEEVVEGLQEFNFGNCLADMNSLLFANYDQMLYTVNQFKYFDASRGAKYNLQTPENFFFVREKQHGTVRDFIDGNLEIPNHPDKHTRDVIMFQMARAVNLLHLRGWTHKNLKNENFYIKRTVDNLIEVRLGEFKKSVMRQTHVVQDNTDDETYGGPFYIPLDAVRHPDDLGVDYAALGALMIELLTDESVEQDYTEIKPEIEKKNSIKLEEVFELNTAEVTKVDKIETEMELKLDDLFTGIDLDVLDNIQASKKIVQENKVHEEQVIKQAETKMQIDEIQNSFNAFDATSLNLGFASVNSFSLDQKSLNLDLRRRERILTKGDYGQNETTLFTIDADKDYGMMNFKSSFSTNENEIINEAMDLEDKEVHHVESLLNPTITLESIEDHVLDNKTIKVEHLAVDIALNNDDMFKEDENKPKVSIKIPQGGKEFNYNYNGQNEVKILVKRMFSENYFERFINLSIFGNDSQVTSDPDFQKIANNNTFQYKLCNMEVTTYLKKIGASQGLMLSTTECLMVFLARAILQNESQQVVDHYFHLLEAHPSKTANMRSMDDVIQMIIDDRKLAASYRGKEMDFTTYINGGRRNILI